MTKDERHERHPFFFLMSDIVRTVSHVVIIAVAIWYFRTELPWDDPLTVEKIRNDYHEIEPTGPFELSFERKVCLDRSGSAVIVVQRRYVPHSGQKVTIKAYSDAIYTALPGCEVISFTVPVPKDLPPGEYEYIPTAVYKKNFFTEDISKVLPTVKFRIMD